MSLVLAPTRELAQQIDKEIRAFGRSSSRSVRSCIVVGGVAMQDQRRELIGGVEIVVATPGRFIDHLQQGNTNLGRVSYVVLDEADRMLDMGFEPQIREVLQVSPDAVWNLDLQHTSVFMVIHMQSQGSRVSCLTAQRSCALELDCIVLGNIQHPRIRGARGHVCMSTSP